MLAAATYGRYFPMFMTAAGTIAPAKVLILGAGASATSRNRLEKNVLQAMGLAETLAKEAGLA